MALLHLVETYLSQLLKRVCSQLPGRDAVWVICVNYGCCTIADSSTGHHASSGAELEYISIREFLQYYSPAGREICSVSRINTPLFLHRDDKWWP